MDSATRLFRVRKTCLEMLQDRDYVIAPVRKPIRADHVTRRVSPYRLQ